MFKILMLQILNITDNDGDIKSMVQTLVDSVPHSCFAIVAANASGHNDDSILKVLGSIRKEISNFNPMKRLLSLE